jgi:hypothetical protein
LTRDRIVRAGRARALKAAAKAPADRFQSASDLTSASADRKSAIRVIICFGIVSFFADMTYEGAHSILGPFLEGLNATAFEVGFVAGLGEKRVFVDKAPQSNEGVDGSGLGVVPDLRQPAVLTDRSRAGDGVWV